MENENREQKGDTANQNKKKLAFTIDLREVFDIFKKSVSHGKDAILSIEQDAEKLLLKKVKRGGLSDTEADDLIESYREKFRERVQTINTKFDKSIQKTLGRLNIATKADLQLIESRLDILIEQIKKIAKAKSKSSPAGK